jgi:hypothetical protein
MPSPEAEIIVLAAIRPVASTICAQQPAVMKCSGGGNKRRSGADLVVAATLSVACAKSTRILSR